MSLRSWWQNLWNRSAISQLSETIAQAHIYFDEQDVFICSNVSCSDRRDGPSEPIAQFQLPVSASEAGAAIFFALTGKQPPVSPDTNDDCVTEAFRRMGVDSWDTLEQRFWRISAWQEDERILFQTMRQVSGGGYVSFKSDYAERSQMCETDLGNAALRAIDALDRTVYVDPPSHP